MFKNMNPSSTVQTFQVEIFLNPLKNVEEEVVFLGAMEFVAPTVGS